MVAMRKALNEKGNLFSCKLPHGMCIYCMLVPVKMFKHKTVTFCIVDFRQRSLLFKLSEAMACCSYISENLAGLFFH